MNKILLFISLMVLTSYSYPEKSLIKDPGESLQFWILQEGGANGSAVVYNPEEKLYYASIAGNSSFPIETYNEKGENVAQFSTGNDLRGMWWNPKLKALEANCYSDAGIVTVGMNASGYPGAVDNKTIFTGMKQPDENSVGVFDPKKKEVLYYHQGEIHIYDRKKFMLKDKLALSLPSPASSFNSTTLIYSGVKGMEIGLLNVGSKRVYLFDRKTGRQTDYVNLPLEEVVEDYFNFSYANDHVFIFDKEFRVWIGYKIFN